MNAFADDKINMAEKLKIERVKEQCGNWRKCWSPPFSFSHNVFKKACVVKCEQNVFKERITA